MEAANGTGTAAKLGHKEKANQLSRSRSLGPAVRHVNGEQASGISGGEVVVAEGEEIGGSYDETLISPDGSAHSGGLWLASSPQLRCRPIG